MKRKLQKNVGGQGHRKRGVVKHGNRLGCRSGASREPFIGQPEPHRPQPLAAGAAPTGRRQPLYLVQQQATLQQNRLHIALEVA